VKSSESVLSIRRQRCDRRIGVSEGKRDSGAIELSTIVISVGAIGEIIAHQGSDRPGAKPIIVDHNRRTFGGEEEDDD